jgi:hypothetical protein
LFFIIYILYKNNIIDAKKDDEGNTTYTQTNTILIKNIPLIMFLVFVILGDLFMSTSYYCNNFFELVVSFAIGSAMGLWWAVILDSTLNSRYYKAICPSYYSKDNQVHVRYNTCNKNNLFPGSYSVAASGKEPDLSLFNVINNPVCNQTNSRTIYKCHNVNRISASPSSSETVSKDITTDLEYVNKSLYESNGPSPSPSQSLKSTVQNIH